MAAPQINTAINALATQINASIQRNIRDQRTYVETLGEQRIRDGHVHGFVNIATAGETIANVSFPIAFLEKPLFTCGLEMADNTWLVQGDFPIWAATVGNWQTQKAAETTLYVGATLGIVALGAVRSILHYSFEGRSFTVPVGTEANVGSPL